jgi:TM2 domain-containing membrane protein YozV
MTRRVMQPRPGIGKEGLGTMSDDTTRTDGWSSTATSRGTPESAAQNAAERVGFCQDCGKPLTQATVRIVGTGVFCEPCLMARVGATPPTSGYTTVPHYTAVPPQAAAAGEPSPVLAAILGLIPGVGAMYNGQFAKGIVHLIIFAILVSLSDNVNGIFGLFVAGWIFYMAFEAYHTAVARRDGLPLPNAFGFNDIGERMGFGKSWGAVSSVKVGGSGAPQTPGATPTMDPVPGSGYVTVNTAPVGTAPDWVGYVPPTTFPGAPPVPQRGPFAAAQPTAPWGHAPYAETYTVAPQVTSRRFPTGALWLIGLGVLILAANLLPDWKLTERWWPPVLFAGLSVWLFTRRLRSGARLVCIIRWPVILMVLAVMLALHAAYFAVTLGLTCSVLLIVFGAVLLLERTAGAGPVYTPPVATTASPGPARAVDAQAEEARSRAAWVAPDGDDTRSDPDGTKGGQ